jgi:hypothetical protein
MVIYIRLNIFKLILSKNNYVTKGINCIKIMLQIFHTTSLMKPPFIVVGSYVNRQTYEVFLE